VRRLGPLALLVLGSASAAADPVVLRLASPAPDGTSWAREGRAFARDVESTTHGAVKFKFYLGGITGDEVETAERIRRGQLDGIASGGAICMKLAPSMRVLRVLGLFQSRDESAYVSGRLRSTLDEEFRKAGFSNVGEMGVGPDTIFSTTPIRTMDDLRKTRMWVWDLDEVLRIEAEAMGIRPVALPLHGAARGFDEGKLDAYFAVPTAALAFQWAAQMHYATDLRAGFLRGCILLSNRAFDALPVDAQQAVRSAGAKLIARLEDLGRRQDDDLMGGLFERQGLKPVPVTPQFRAEFFEAARKAREKLGDKLVPPALLQRVLGMLADYRAEHRSSEGDKR
jgi:TRAP-type transport system periplasmic protein